MTNGEFIKYGQQITGRGRGYQKPLADKIGKSLVQVKKYAAGRVKIPLTVEKLILELINK